MIRYFPRVKHFVGSNAAADDLILSEREQEVFLKSQVAVYEKLDGVNVAIGLGNQGRVVCALRPAWRGSLGGAVERSLDIYVRQREPALRRLLRPGRTLFGEWLWHRVSKAYTSLTEELLLFAVVEPNGQVYGARKLAKQVEDAGMTAVQEHWRGRLGTLAKLRSLVGPSAFGSARMEGLVVERLLARKGDRFAKWVESSYRHVCAGLHSGKKNRLRESR